MEKNAGIHLSLGVGGKLRHGWLHYQPEQAHQLQVAYPHPGFIGSQAGSGEQPLRTSSPSEFCGFSWVFLVKA